MKKYKKLPQVLPNEYEVSASIDKKNYKLTEESQLFRDKLADFFVNKVKRQISLS